MASSGALPAACRGFGFHFSNFLASQGVSGESAENGLETRKPKLERRLSTASLLAPMITSICENGPNDRNSDARGSAGVYGKPSRDKQLGNSAAGRCKEIFNGFPRRRHFQYKQAQDSLQDAGERVAVLLDARPAVGLMGNAPSKGVRRGSGRMLKCVAPWVGS